jgi:3-oxoacyl-[acyl-carrier protein] reductase
MMAAGGNLAGQVAIVTGAGRGIGAATATRLASDGAAVVLVDVAPDGIESLGAALRGEGRDVLTVHADVSKAADVAGMVAAVVERFGRVDILINNAGIVRYRPTVEMTDDEWDEMLDINLKGAFLCVRSAAPHMMRRRAGKIVNISSVTAYGAITPGQLHYAASKAGLLGLTRTLALELGPYNINVNAVAPGAIVTEMTRQAAASVGQSFDDFVAQRSPAVALRRLGRPEDVAAVISFLVSNDAAFVHGEVIHVAGGPVVRT